MAQTHFELRTDPSGDVALRIDRLEHIGLKNIADLKSYNMSRVGNRIMHLMEFANDGTLELTLLLVGSNSARIEVFKGQHVSLERVGNDLLVGQMATNAAKPGVSSGAAPEASRNRSTAS